MRVFDGVDYNISHDCENSGCLEEGMCRCGVVDSTPTGVDYPAIFEYIKRQKIPDGNRVREYCLDRLLRRIHRLDNPDSWSCEGTGDYYGQSFDYAQTVSGDVDKDLDLLSILGPDAAVRMILTKEYGHVLDPLESALFTVEQVALEDVVIPNLKHFESCRQDPFYAQAGQPAGVASCILRRTANDQLVLVDGYHRLVHLKGQVTAVIASAPAPFPTLEF